MRSLILNGHVDTVAPGDPARWASGDPFDGRVEDGRLFGLGASDMKSGLVAAAWAARALEIGRGPAAGRPDPRERRRRGEHGAPGGLTATIERGYRADAAIVAEPTSVAGPPTLATCSGGGTVFTVTIEGRTAHPCARGNHIWPGGTGERHAVNAIDKAFYVAQGIRHLEEEWGRTRSHPLFPGGFFTIGPDTILGTLHGQTFSWAVANECALEYLVMYEPDRTQAEVRAEIEAYLDGLYAQDSWLSEHRPAIAWPHTWPPYETAPDHPIARTVERAHERAAGEPVVRQGFSAVDDATFFERAGIPAVSYGPGSILTCHCFDESVPIDDLMKAALVYAETAIEWCGVAARIQRSNGADRRDVQRGSMIEQDIAGPSAASRHGGRGRAPDPSRGARARSTVRPRRTVAGAGNQPRRVRAGRPRGGRDPDRGRPDRGRLRALPSPVRA